MGTLSYQWDGLFLAGANHSFDLTIDVQPGASGASISSVYCGTIEAVLLFGLFYKCPIKLDALEAYGRLRTVDVFAVDTAGVRSEANQLFLYVETGFISQFVSAVKKVAKPLEPWVAPVNALSRVTNEVFGGGLELAAYVRPIEASDIAGPGSHRYFKDEGMVGFKFSVSIAGVSLIFALAAEYEYHSIPRAVLSGSGTLGVAFPFPSPFGVWGPKIELEFEGSVQGKFSSDGPGLGLALDELEVSLSCTVGMSLQLPLTERVFKNLVSAELRISGTLRVDTSLVRPDHPESSGVNINVPRLPPMQLKRFRTYWRLQVEFGCRVGSDWSSVQLEGGLYLVIGIGYPSSWAIRLGGYIKFKIKFLGFELFPRWKYSSMDVSSCKDGPPGSMCQDEGMQRRTSSRRMAPQDTDTHPTVMDVAAYRQVRPAIPVTFSGDAPTQRAVLLVDAIPSMLYSIALAHGAREGHVLAVWTEHQSARNASVSGTDLGGYTLVVGWGTDPGPGEEAPVLPEPRSVLAPEWNDQQPHAAAVPGSGGYAVVWTRTAREGVNPFARTGTARIMYLISAGGPVWSVGAPTPLTDGGFDVHPFVASNPNPRGPAAPVALVVWLHSLPADRHRVGVAFMFPGEPRFVRPGPLRTESFPTKQRLVAALYGGTAAVACATADGPDGASRIRVSLYAEGAWTPFRLVAPNQTDSAGATVAHRGAEGKFLVCFADPHRVRCADTQTRETVVVAAMRADALTATRADGAVRLSWVALDEGNALASVLLPDGDPVVGAGVQLVANSSDPGRAVAPLATAAKGNVLHILSQPRVVEHSPPGCTGEPASDVECATYWGQAALEYSRYVLVSDLALRRAAAQPDFETGAMNLSVTVASVGSLGSPGGHLTVDGGGVFAETQGSLVVVPPLDPGEAMQVHVLLDRSASVTVTLEPAGDDDMTNNVLNFTHLVAVRLTGVWDAARSDSRHTRLVAGVEVTGPWTGAVTVKFFAVLARSRSEDVELGVATARRHTVEVPSSELQASLLVDRTAIPEDAVMLRARLAAPQQHITGDPATAAFSTGAIASPQSGHLCCLH